MNKLPLYNMNIVFVKNYFTRCKHHENFFKELAKV